MDQVGSKPAIPGLEVRALKNEVERNAYFQMHARIFRDREEIEEVAGARRDLITGEPLFAPEQMRGAFLNGQLVGGYMQLKRVLCIDEAQFSTGCISGVWTDPDVRKQGIASALMQEAIPFAAEQGHSLLLLEGIPNFYHRFGHIDVCEFMTEQLIDRAKLASLPASPYTIRPLTQADAPALLELYRKEQGGSPVNFVSSRTMEIEEHLLSDWFEVLEGPSVVAVSPENRVEGYLMLAHHWERVEISEAAARTWPAALALLHHHNNLLEQEPEPTAKLSWPVQMNTPLYYLLADHLRLGTTAFSVPRGGWMARPIHLDRLLGTYQPLLQARWQAGHIPWAGTFTWQIADDYWQVELAASGVVSLAPASASAAQPWARLSLQAFTQLLFGFRPISYLASQPENTIAPELLPAFQALFPTRPSWIARSDFF